MAKTKAELETIISEQSEQNDILNDELIKKATRIREYEELVERLESSIPSEPVENDDREELADALKTARRDLTIAQTENDHARGEIESLESEIAILRKNGATSEPAEYFDPFEDEETAEKCRDLQNIFVSEMLVETENAKRSPAVLVSRKISDAINLVKLVDVPRSSDVIILKANLNRCGKKGREFIAENYYRGVVVTAGEIRVDRLF